MPSLVYSAAGTQHMMGSKFQSLNLAKLDPGMLLVSNGADPTEAQSKAEKSSTFGQRLRASLLQTLGFSEDDLNKMKPETRADLETNMARDIHEQALASPNAPTTGAVVDVKV